MKKLFIVIFAASIFFGCASSPQYKPHGRKTSLSWQWGAFANTNKLAPGMTLGEVKAVFPFPIGTNKSVSNGSTRLQIIFEYGPSKRIYLYFLNDVLTGWQE